MLAVVLLLDELYNISPFWFWICEKTEVFRYIWPRTEFSLENPRLKVHRAYTDRVLVCDGSDERTLPIFKKNRRINRYVVVCGSSPAARTASFQLVKCFITWYSYVRTTSEIHCAKEVYQGPEPHHVWHLGFRLYRVKELSSFRLITKFQFPERLVFFIQIRLSIYSHWETLLNMNKKLYIFKRCLICWFVENAER